MKNVSKFEQHDFSSQQEKHLSKIIQFLSLLYNSPVTNGESLMKQYFGFSIATKKSQIEDAGTGVFVEQGSIPKHSMVAFYPGIKSDTNNFVL